MGCLKCGKELTQTPGKRPRIFCSVSCRSASWQMQKKIKSGRQKGKAGRPRKEIIDEGNAPKIQKFSSRIPSEGPLKPVEPQPTSFPIAYNELLRLAKAGVADQSAFKKHVDALKLTPNQQSMIYANLK